MTAPTEIPNSFPQESELLPDSNTAQAITYGSSYRVMMDILWAWDAMEDHLIQTSQELESQLMDREWCFDVLRRNRYLIFAQSPPVNEVEHLKDLQILRQLCKVQAALHKIDEFRQKNIAWGRMQGTKEYVAGLEGQGISESKWKASTSEWNTRPINYNNVNHPSETSDDDINWAEAYRDLIGAKNYDKLVRKLNLEDEVGPFEENTGFWEDDEESEESGESEQDSGESGESDGDAEESEEGVEAPRDETQVESGIPVEPSDGLSEGVAVMFDDPVGDLMFDGPSKSRDDIQDYLKRADLDNRGIIDWLIGCAEAA